MLMCKVFPSSLKPTTLRWFNGLRKGSIHNFRELIQEFGVRFMMCSRVPQLVDMLLSMKMGEGETLRSYASRYWELYNEIDGGNEKVAASMFRLSLPKDSKLRESLTKRPFENMRQLIRRIEEYKRLEDDREQSKGKAPCITILEGVLIRGFSAMGQKGVKDSRAQCSHWGNQCGVYGTCA